MARRAIPQDVEAWYDVDTFGPGDPVRLIGADKIVEGIATGELRRNDKFDWVTEIQTAPAVFVEVNLRSIDKVQVGE